MAQQKSVCNDDNLKVSCKVCHERILRGGNTLKSFSAMNMREHGWLTASRYHISGILAKEYSISTV